MNLLTTLLSALRPKLQGAKMIVDNRTYPTLIAYDKLQAAGYSTIEAYYIVQAAQEPPLEDYWNNPAIVRKSLAVFEEMNIDAERIRGVGPYLLEPAFDGVLPQEIQAAHDKLQAAGYTKEVASRFTTVVRTTNPNMLEELDHQEQAAALCESLGIDVKELRSRRVIEFGLDSMPD